MSRQWKAMTAARSLAGTRALRTIRVRARDVDEARRVAARFFHVTAPPPPPKVGPYRAEPIVVTEAP